MPSSTPARCVPFDVALRKLVSESVRLTFCACATALGPGRGVQARHCRCEGACECIRRQAFCNSKLMIVNVTGIARHRPAYARRPSGLGGGDQGASQPSQPLFPCTRGSQLALPQAPVSSSDLQCPPLGGMTFAKPRPLTVPEIDGLVKAWGYGAKVLYEAGADGAQMHSAHGYLLYVLMPVILSATRGLTLFCRSAARSSCPAVSTSAPTTTAARSRTASGS